VPELSPPLIPLTLPAMNRSRRHFHSSRRPALVLFSVLGLLASLCFVPVIHAETVYDPEQTRIPGNPQPGDQDSKNSSTREEEEARASASGSAGGSGGSQNGSEDGSSAGKSASTGSGEGTRQGSPGNGSSMHDKSSATNSQDDLAGSAASTSDDGSSPLVPILIVIAALAAISIGVVVARKRRGLGESVSPKAS
jgi:cobalamin biosynthesis Mg chelatase CobN